MTFEDFDLFDISGAVRPHSAARGGPRVIVNVVTCRILHDGGRHGGTHGRSYLNESPPQKNANMYRSRTLSHVYICIRHGRSHGVDVYSETRHVMYVYASQLLHEPRTRKCVHVTDCGVHVYTSQTV